MKRRKNKNVERGKNVLTVRVRRRGEELDGLLEEPSRIETQQVLRAAAALRRGGTRLKVRSM